MSKAPTGKMIARGINGQESAEEKQVVVRALPDSETAPIKELTAYCREVGITPEGWGKMKAENKRVAFKRKFCPEAIEGVFDSGDKLHLIAEMIENLKKEEALKLLPTLTEDVGDNYFKLGGVFSATIAKSWYKEWGFDNFKEWLEAETDTGLRKAAYLTKIYNRLVELGIPWGEFEGISWPRVIEVLPVITTDNVAEWVALAKETTIDALKGEVAAARKKIEGKAGSETTTKQKLFKLHPDQIETVEAALDMMKKQLPTTHDNVALEHICAAYLTDETGVESLVAAGSKLTTIEECEKGLDTIFSTLKGITGTPFEACKPIVEIFERLFTKDEAEMEITATGADD